MESNSNIKIIKIYVGDTRDCFKFLVWSYRFELFIVESFLVEINIFIHYGLHLEERQDIVVSIFQLSGNITVIFSSW